MSVTTQDQNSDIVGENRVNAEIDWDNVFITGIFTLLEMLIACPILVVIGNTIRVSTSLWWTVGAGVAALVLAALSAILGKKTVELLGEDPLLENTDHLRVPKNVAAGFLVTTCLAGFALGLWVPFKASKLPTAIEERRSRKNGG